MSTLMIIEYLIIRLQYEKKHHPQGFPTTEGTLVLSVDIKTSLQDVNLSHCITIIASNGDIWQQLLSDQICKEIESLLLPLGQSKTQTGRGCPHEPLHIMPFQFSFELYEKSEVLGRDCIAMKQFIHRISLVCTMVKFHYCVKLNGSISAETYSSESKASICLPDGMRLLTGTTHFVRPVSRNMISSCDKIHPVTGEPVGLFIPEEVAGRGYNGELRLIPVVALCPCQKPFPNQLTRITSLSVFLYDPAGLPVLISTKETSCSFFQDPSYLVSWERYSYSATLISHPYWEEDTTEPDIRYKLQGINEEDPDAVEQRLLLFLFLTQSDPFQDKPVYNFCDRQVILSHLSPILLCSKQAVKEGIERVVRGILEQHSRVAKEQQKLAKALPIMADAISCIVSSSCDHEFRKKCFQGLQVADSHELQLNLKETLSKVILKLWKPSSSCDIKKPLRRNDEAGQLSTDVGLPSTQLRLLSSNSLEKAGQGSGGKEGLSSNRSELGGVSQSKKWRPRSTDFFEEDSEDLGVSGGMDKTRDHLLAELEGSFSSNFPCPTKTGHGILLCRSRGTSAAPAANRFGQNEEPWQDDDFWNQEVTNLADWTS